MEDETSVNNTSISVTNKCLVVNIPSVLQDKTIRLLQQDVLDAVRKTGAKGIVLDLSNVRILDAFLTTGILNTAKMLSVMGATPVLTGIRPEVAASIVYMNIEIKDIACAIDLEDAQNMLTPVIAAKADDTETPEEIDDAEKTGIEAENNEK